MAFGKSFPAQEQQDDPCRGHYFHFFTSLGIHLLVLERERGLEMRSLPAIRGLTGSSRIPSVPHLQKKACHTNDNISGTDSKEII
jgi:hypothetical protein